MLAARLGKTQDPCDPQFPSVVAPEEMAERLQKLAGGATAPLNVHLRQEVDRLNIVLRIARETLESLRLAIAGGCPALLGAIPPCCCLPCLIRAAQRRVHADPHVLV